MIMLVMQANNLQAPHQVDAFRRVKLLDTFGHGFPLKEKWDS